MEKLFNLVKSLNGMEKRYFKLAVSAHESGGTNYMRLFDAIAQQKIYDDAALREELDGDPMLKRFDMSKNYLYKLVLNTLQNYHRQSSVEHELMNMLNRALILYDKLLYKPCYEILEKTRKLAVQYEYYEILLQALQLMIRVAMAEKKDIEFTDPLHREHAQALAKIERINQYKRLYHRLYTFFNKKGNDLRVHGLRAQYSAFLNSRLLLGKTKPEGYEQKNYFLLAKGLCHYCLGHSEKSYDYARQQMELIRSHPHRIKEDPETYVTALNSVIFYGSVLGKVEELETVFASLEKFLNDKPLLRHRIFIAYDNMMALYTSQGLFKEGLVFAERVKKELPDYEEHIFDSNKVSLYYDMFYIYFGSRKYQASLEWMNRLLNETGLKVREDIQLTARLTNLILHYELKNFDLLPYLLRRTYDYLNKRKQSDTIEKTLLRFMSKLLRIKTDRRKDMMQVFSEIKGGMQQLARKPAEARMLTEYFDYASWLESKIENRPFERIVQEKAASKNG